MLSTAILNIAIPSPLRSTFDYLPPLNMSIEEALQLQAGTRLRVNFANQLLIGILLDVKDRSDVPAEKLKPALDVIENTPCFTPETLSLCLWAADYYQHPIGEALATALPTLLRQGELAALPAEKMWALTINGKGLPRDSLKRAPKQSALLNAFFDAERLSAEDIKKLSASSATLKELIKKELVEEIIVDPSTRPTDAMPIDATPTDLTPAGLEPSATTLLKQTPLTLNAEQESAFNQLRFQEFNTYLLEGTTGSGKTEVYLQAITRVLENNQSALVLVPEIGLTPQLIQRFENRFNVPVVTLHSGLNDKERLHAWLNASLGKARIVIGTRSAVFTPIPNLGVIIIDEEHDLSFKQQDGFRYSARDIAVVRSHKLGIPLILGTATPSLETLYNAIQNRYQHLRLTQRAGSAKPPHIEMIDLREQKPTEGFSRSLLDTIREELEKGNQALIFINRRGFAPVMMCEDCGWIAGCNQCSAKMTVHQHPPHLHCHHCGQQRGVPRKCPDCFSSSLTRLGYGTERTEAYLQEQFPDIPVHRVDRDTTRRKNALANITDLVHQGEPCILVGTQMLAKGHHFPDVTLVGIIDVDSGLFSADFRGPERMGQLVIQVAGRAGRESKPGKVVIQSYHCDHPNIQSLINEGYHRYARRLLHERQLTGLPPYRFMALIRSESKRPENATEFLKIARQLTQQQFPSTPHLGYLGPLPGLMERKKDRYCFQLQISSDNRHLLHQVTRYLCQTMDAHALSRRTRWSIDIDPVDMT